MLRLHFANSIICNSRDTRHSLLKILRNAKIIEKIHVISNPVLPYSVDYNIPLSSSSNAYVDSTIKLVTIGRLVPQKSLHLFIPILKSFADRDIKVSLDIYGEGYLHHDLVDQFVCNDLHSSVSFKGFSNNILSI